MTSAKNLSLLTSQWNIDLILKNKKITIEYFAIERQLWLVLVLKRLVSVFLKVRAYCQYAALNETVGTKKNKKDVMDQFLKIAIQPADNIHSTSGVAKIWKVVNRKYIKDYIRSQGLICGEQFAKQAMVLHKLICRLKQNMLIVLTRVNNFSTNFKLK